MNKCKCVFLLFLCAAALQNLAYSSEDVFSHKPLQSMQEESRSAYLSLENI